MADIAAIRTALATVLDADSDLDGVSIYNRVQPNPHLPAIHVGPPDSINYHDTYSGCTVTLTLTLEVARHDHLQAQRTLDAWLSKPGPIYALSTATNAAWDSVAVDVTQPPRSLGNPEQGETPSLAVDVTVTVTT